MESPQLFPVQEQNRGQRLDRFLAEQLHLSRSQVRRLLARGVVRVDGRAVAESEKGLNLQPGPVVEVAPFSRPENQQATPSPEQPLSLLAEGPGFVVVDKPAGVPVHPLEEREVDTVLNALIARFPEIHGVGEGGLRSGVAHRLDVDTSGALLFATEESVWQQARSAFREHRVEKRYRAIVVGALEGEGALEVGLVTARHRPAKVRVIDSGEGDLAPGVRLSSLSWRSLEVFGSTSLIEVRPKTGHLHQIRVSLQHLGFPVLGDRTYGAKREPLEVPRQMLHAAHLCWGPVDVHSPDPADFQQVLEQLRATRSNLE